MMLLILDSRVRAHACVSDLLNEIVGGANHGASFGSLTHFRIRFSLSDEFEY